jgi:hypothetical protein
LYQYGFGEAVEVSILFNPIVDEDDANVHYRAVKKLVGELDFSFHIVSTQSSSATSSSDTLISSIRDKQD